MASINLKSKDREASEITDKEIPQKFNYMKKKVAIVKLDDYQPHNIQNALKRVFDLLNLTPYVKNKNVLLKPNAVACK